MKNEETKEEERLWDDGRFLAQVVSGADGAIYRGEDLGGKTDDGGSGEILSWVIVSVLNARGTSNGTYSLSSLIYRIWSIGASSGLGEGVICIYVVFHARKVNERTERGADRLLGTSLFKWHVEKEDLLPEIEYFDSLIAFETCLSVPLCPTPLSRFMSILVWFGFFFFFFLESAWLHPCRKCRKSTLWATPSPKNLGSWRKRHFTHTLSSLRRAVWYPAQWGKVEPSCVVKFLSGRSFSVTGEIMKEKYSTGLDKFNGF